MTTKLTMLMMLIVIISDAVEADAGGETAKSDSSSFSGINIANFDKSSSSGVATAAVTASSVALRVSCSPVRGSLAAGNGTTCVSLSSVEKDQTNGRDNDDNAFAAEAEAEAAVASNDELLSVAADEELDDDDTSELVVDEEPVTLRSNEEPLTSDHLDTSDASRRSSSSSSSSSSGSSGSISSSSNNNNNNEDDYNDYGAYIIYDNNPSLATATAATSNSTQPELANSLEGGSRPQLGDAASSNTAPEARQAQLSRQPLSSPASSLSSSPSSSSSVFQVIFYAAMAPDKTTTTATDAKHVSAIQHLEGEVDASETSTPAALAAKVVKSPQMPLAPKLKSDAQTHPANCSTGSGIAPATTALLSSSSRQIVPQIRFSQAVREQSNHFGASLYDSHSLTTTATSKLAEHINLVSSSDISQQQLQLQLQLQQQQQPLLLLPLQRAAVSRQLVDYVDSPSAKVDVFTSTSSSSSSSSSTQPHSGEDSAERPPLTASSQMLHIQPVHYYLPDTQPTKALQPLPLTIGNSLNQTATTKSEWLSSNGSSASNLTSSRERRLGRQHRHLQLNSNSLLALDKTKNPLVMLDSTKATAAAAALSSSYVASGNDELVLGTEEASTSLPDKPSKFWSTNSESSDDVDQESIAATAADDNDQLDEEDVKWLKKMNDKRKSFFSTSTTKLSPSLPISSSSSSQTSTAAKLSEEQTASSGRKNNARLDEQTPDYNDSSLSSSFVASATATSSKLFPLPSSPNGTATSSFSTLSTTTPVSASNLHTNQVSNQDTSSSSASKSSSSSRLKFAAGRTAGGRAGDAHKPHVDSSSSSLSRSSPSQSSTTALLFLENLNGTTSTKEGDAPDRGHLRAASINANYNNNQETVGQDYSAAHEGLGGGSSGSSNESALYLSSATTDLVEAIAKQQQQQHHQQQEQEVHNMYFWNLIWLILPVGAVFGNLLVIMAVCMERSLQSVTNYFIVSLAFADLFVGLIVMPFAVYVLVNNVWELGDAICDIYVAVDVTCSTASILNLVAISIDRYRAVAHPISYSARSGNTLAILIIIAVWLTSCTTGGPIILGLNTSPERKSTLCIFYNSTFIFWSSIISFYGPCIIMIALYWRIFSAIRSRTKKAIRGGPAGAGVGPGTGTGGEHKALVCGDKMVSVEVPLSNQATAGVDSAPKQQMSTNQSKKGSLGDKNQTAISNISANAQHQLMQEAISSANGSSVRKDTMLAHLAPPAGDQFSRQSQLQLEVGAANQVLPDFNTNEPSSQIENSLDAALCYNAVTNEKCSISTCLTLSNAKKAVKADSWQQCWKPLNAESLITLSNRLQNRISNHSNCSSEANRLFSTDRHLNELNSSPPDNLQHQEQSSGTCSVSVALESLASTCDLTIDNKEPSQQHSHSAGGSIEEYLSRVNYLCERALNQEEDSIHEDHHLRRCSEQSYLTAICLTLVAPRKTTITSATKPSLELIGGTMSPISAMLSINYSSNREVIDAQCGQSNPSEIAHHLYFDQAMTTLKATSVASASASLSSTCTQLLNELIRRGKAELLLSMKCRVQNSNSSGFQQQDDVTCCVCCRVALPVQVNSVAQLGCRQLPSRICLMEPIVVGAQSGTDNEMPMCDLSKMNQLALMNLYEAALLELVSCTSISSTESVAEGTGTGMTLLAWSSQQNVADEAVDTRNTSTTIEGTQASGSDERMQFHFRRLSSRVDSQQHPLCSDCLDTCLLCALLHIETNTKASSTTGGSTATSCQQNCAPGNVNNSKQGVAVTTAVSSSNKNSTAAQPLSAKAVAAKSSVALVKRLTQVNKAQKRHSDTCAHLTRLIEQEQRAAKKSSRLSASEAQHSHYLSDSSDDDDEQDSKSESSGEDEEEDDDDEDGEQDEVNVRDEGKRRIGRKTSLSRSSSSSSSPSTSSSPSSSSSTTHCSGSAGYPIGSCSLDSSLAAYDCSATTTTAVAAAAHHLTGNDSRGCQVGNSSARRSCCELQAATSVSGANVCVACERAKQFAAVNRTAMATVTATATNRSSDVQSVATAPQSHQHTKLEQANNSSSCLTPARLSPNIPNTCSISRTSNSPSTITAQEPLASVGDRKAVGLFSRTNSGTSVSAAWQRNSMNSSFTQCECSISDYDCHKSSFHHQITSNDMKSGAKNDNLEAAPSATISHLPEVNNAAQPTIGITSRLKTRNSIKVTDSNSKQLDTTTTRCIDEDQSAPQAIPDSCLSEVPVTTTSNQVSLGVIQNATDKIKRRSLKLTRLITTCRQAQPKSSPKLISPLNQSHTTSDDPFGSSANICRLDPRSMATSSGLQSSLQPETLIEETTLLPTTTNIDLFSNTNQPNMSSESNGTTTNRNQQLNSQTKSDFRSGETVKDHSSSRHKCPDHKSNCPSCQHSHEVESKRDLDGSKQPTLMSAMVNLLQPQPRKISNRKQTRLINSENVIVSLRRKTGSRRKREKNAARRERKATKTLAIVLGVFLICWTPFFTCNIIDGICIQLNIDCRPSMSVYLVTSWLGYINSCVNPIIYTIFNMEFRRAFKKLLTTKPTCFNG